VASSNSRGYLRGRLVGRIIEFHNAGKGFAFLSTGPNTPQYYVSKFAVPAEHWFEGSLLEFTPAPPRSKGTNMRAVDILPRNQNEAEPEAEQERAS